MLTVAREAAVAVTNLRNESGKLLNTLLRIASKCSFTRCKLGFGILRRPNSCIHAVVRLFVDPRRVFSSLTLSFDKRKAPCYLIVAVLLPIAAEAAVLPEDRTDLIYHTYDGGGSTIDGPAILVRKNFAEKVSLWGRYYEDVVSGASIDVEATASAFEEKRTEYSLGADYLYDKTTMNLGYTNSDSGDYLSDSYSLGVSHDFFGDLTTVAMSFGFSDEIVRSSVDEAFEDTVTTQSYAVSVSQVLTRNIIVGLTAQTITSEGYLNNPYRTVRFVDSNPLGYSYEPELYPRTRNSDALAIRYNHYLPYRASIRGEFRIFSDSWGIQSNTFRLDYIHPIQQDLTLHLNFRYYDQTAADFYNDLFPFSEATNFRARDKELGTFETLSYGIGASYNLPSSWIPFVDRSSLNLFVDQVNYEYADFRDVTSQTSEGLPFTAGQEPLYSFDALAVRFFISFWY